MVGSIKTLIIFIGEGFGFISLSSSLETLLSSFIASSSFFLLLLFLLEQWDRLFAFYELEYLDNLICIGGLSLPQGLLIKVSDF